MAVKMGGGKFGQVLAEPGYNTSEIFDFAGVDSDGVDFGRYESGKYIPVQATRGDLTGMAEISQQELGGEKYLITILIPKKVFAKNLISGWIRFEWATALCGNSPVEAWFYLVLPPSPTLKEVGLPYYSTIRVRVPVVVPTPAAVWLFASGLGALLAWRRWR